MSDFIKWLKKHVCEDDAWITVHPNASGPGSPVLVDDEGYIKGGMGGKFNGQRIDLIPRKSGYGLPVSENDPLNKSTPGFLRTFRYNLKAPENVASQATLTAEQTARIEKNKSELKDMLERYRGFAKKFGWQDENFEKRAVEAEKKLTELSTKIETRQDLTQEQKDDMGRRLVSYLDADVTYLGADVEKSALPAKTDNVTVVYDAKRATLFAAANGEVLNTSPATLGGVSKGNPMSVNNADDKNANPDFEKKDSAKINCQACVIAYEARRRGYDVEATLNTRGSVNSAVSRDWTCPLVDPKTGIPRQATPVSGGTAEKVYKWLEQNVKPGERYILECIWKGRGSGHVQNLEIVDGKMRIVDAQSGKILEGESLKARINQMSLRGDKVPTLLRTDDLAFNPGICDKLLIPKRR